MMAEPLRRQQRLTPWVSVQPGYARPRIWLKILAPDTRNSTIQGKEQHIIPVALHQNIGASRGEDFDPGLDHGHRLWRWIWWRPILSPGQNKYWHGVITALARTDIAESAYCSSTDRYCSVSGRISKLDATI
jgi:hypothetical protein